MTEDPGPVHGNATTPRPVVSDQPSDAPPPGRRVILTPTPPGLWLVIGGAVVAALGPLFGFLVGTMMGSTTDVGGLDPIYLMLFLGIVLGGVGVAAALFGARTMLRNWQASDS